MKRDWEVIRDILVKIENEDDICASLSEYDEEKYQYHIKLLIESELIQGSIKKMVSGEVSCKVDRLTWKGHDFLDDIRSNSIWSKTKNILKEKGLGMSFEIIKKTAIKFAEEMI